MSATCMEADDQAGRWQSLPQGMAAADAQAILDACEHLRDRLLLGLLLDTGMFSRGAYLDTLVVVG